MGVEGGGEKLKEGKGGGGKKGVEGGSILTLHRFTELALRICGKIKIGERGGMGEKEGKRKR